MLRISKYSQRLIILYVVLIPILFIFANSEGYYVFTNQNSGLATTISVGSIFILVLFLIYKNGISRVSLTQVILAVVYGALFAFPEEIIFRGAVQGFLQQHFSSAFIIIFLSAGIFGLAHLPNKAKSLNPKGWNWKFASLAFLGGVPLGVLFLLTDSLIFPTVLHALFLICLQLCPQKGDKVSEAHCSTRFA